MTIGRISWVILLLAASAFDVNAQAPDRGWERLQRVPATQRVKVHLNDGTKIEGTIRELGPTGITLVHKQGERLIPYADVARVTHKSRAWAALLGAGIGAAVSCPIGLAAAAYVTDRNRPSTGDRFASCAAFGLVFGGAGAGIGAAAGMDRTIFKPSPAKSEAAIRR